MSSGFTFRPYGCARKIFFLWLTQFLARFCREYGKDLNFSPQFLGFLEQYDWPGNVRQLENLIERSVITVQDPIIDVTALPPEYASQAPAVLQAQSGTLAQRMDAYEGEIIRDAYRRWGTTVGVAKELGISQPTAARRYPNTSTADVSQLRVSICQNSRTA